MSAQTGVPSIPPPPPTSRGVARMRGELQHLRSSPNPVLIRELRQSARLTRTPYVLMAMTALTALLVCSIGGIMAFHSNPALTGVTLHQVFFSIAYFVVTLAGPAVAANSIASEREGRTWEALQLTGLPPGVVARGKFLAAYTNVALYIVMMAPVGALPFLFGGVTAAEVVLAFVWLFLLAGLSVAFGLAISSKMENLRGALLVTLLLSFMVSPTVFVGLGSLLSIAVHDLWSGVPRGVPVWLPTAYERAHLDLAYLGYLVAAPLLAVVLPAWFLYEVTIANLTSPTDDRSSGVRRWFLVSSALLSAGSALVIVATSAGTSTAPGVTILMASLAFLFLVFSAFVFAGEPIGPSRRVIARWDRDDIGRFGRFLGPGVMRAAMTLLVSGAGWLTLLFAAGALGVTLGSSGSKSTDLLGLTIMVGYSAAFFVFVTGFTAWMRTRSNSPSTARIMMVVMLFLAAAGPWIVAAIVGALSSGSDESLLVAAPSPIYAIVAAAQVAKSGSDPALTVSAATFSAAGWALLGVGLLGRATVRCNEIIAAHEAAIAEGDAMLAAEDAARREA
jgi:hypothetical protein